VDNQKPQGFFHAFQIKWEVPESLRLTILLTSHESGNFSMLRHCVR